MALWKNMLDATYGILHAWVSMKKINFHFLMYKTSSRQIMLISDSLSNNEGNKIKIH
jgi:hypothetical protein